MPEHTPLTDAELETFAGDAFVMTGAAVATNAGVIPPRGMILKLAKDLRESRRLLRAVDDDNAIALRYEPNVSGETIHAIETYLAACEGKAQP